MIVIALLAPIAYHLTFSLFAPYDDEGSVMVPLKEYISHGNLYDQVFWGYGPFYVEFWGAIFKATGIGINSDSARFIIIGIWLVASTLAAAMAYAATRNVLLSIATQLLTFRCLYTLANEPMHPDGLIVLVLAILLAVGFLVLPRRRDLAMTLVGVFLASLLLIKVNVGGFVVLGTLLALVSYYPVLASRRVIRLPMEALVLVTPIVLMSKHLSDSWALIYALHVSVAVLTVVLVLRTVSPQRGRELRELVPLAVGFGSAIVVELGVAVATGTSLSGLYNGIVGDPLRFPNAFTVPLQLPRGVLVFDLIALVGCVAFFVDRRSGREPGPGYRILLGVVSIGVGVLLGVTAAGFVFPNAIAHGSGRADLGAIALAWLVIAARPSGGETAFDLPVRLLLCIAVLHTLHAYPVAGSQVAFSAFPLIPLGAICVANGLAELSRSLQEAVARPAARWAAVAFTAVLAVWAGKAVVIDQGRAARDMYDAGVPLRLAGAERLRLAPEAVAAYAGVTHQLQKHCRTFFGFPGMDSFYLFAQQDSPTPLADGDWMYVWDAGKQRRALADIKAQKGLCILRNDGLASAYSHNGRFPNRPLYRWLSRTRFKVVARVDGFRLLRERGGGVE